jgi:hypothetical protein
MELNMMFIFIGMASAIVSTAVFIFLLIKNKNALNTRILYVGITLLHLYLAWVYFITCTGAIDFATYGLYIRPVLLLIILSSAMVALLHRR